MSEVSIPVGDALDAWIADLRLRDQASTARTYASSLKPLRALYHEPEKYHDGATMIPGYMVSELTPAICRELAADRLRSGMQPNSLRSWVAALLSFGRFCVEQGWCQTNFAEGVPRPRERKVLRRYLSPAQARAVWEAASDPYDRLILLLGAGSGLRRAEIAGLRLRDVDFTHGTVRVYGKGRKWREVAVDARALEMMSSVNGEIRTRAPATNPKSLAVAPPCVGPQGLRRLTIQPDSGTSTLRPNSTTDRIFPFSYSALKYRVARMGRKAGVPGLHCHMLRHLAAQQFLAEGGDAFSLQAMLGHSNMKTTLTYVEDRQREISLQRQLEIDLGRRLFR